MLTLRSVGQKGPVVSHYPPGP